MEAMEELGGEFVAGVCARAVRVASRIKWQAKTDLRTSFTIAIYYVICDAGLKWNLGGIGRASEPV